MRSRQGFSLLELLVVVTIIALLAGILLPALSRFKESSRRTACLSNLRQLNLAMGLYADDHDDSYPARITSRQWPGQLQPYYLQADLLRCPSDNPSPDTTGFTDPASFDQAPRSYLLNGFGDPNVTHPSKEDWLKFLAGPCQGTIERHLISQPAETVLFGEKISDSTRFYLELTRQPGDYLEILELSRHGSVPKQNTRAGARAGGSNHAFADGSVRYLPNGKSVCPVNLWGVTDYYRKGYAACLF